VAHSPECPEDQDKYVNHGDPGEREKTLAAECFSQITKARRRHVHHFLTTAPEEQSRDNHCNAGNSERPAWSPLGICKKPRAENGGDKRPRVNRKIEPP